MAISTSNNANEIKKPLHEPKPVRQRSEKASLFNRLKVLIVGIVAVAFFYANKSNAKQSKVSVSSATQSWPNRGELELQKCENYDAPFVCGWLGAPLDYTNADTDSRNASISVIIYPAGKGKTPADEVLGSILLNPGGPGVSGVWFVGEGRWYNESLVEHLDTASDHKYNLVGFDPRGTGNTYPRTNCFGDVQENEKKIAYYSALAADGFPGYNTENRQDFEIGRLLAQKQSSAQTCAESKDSELLKFMSTPFVARDMQLLHRASGDKKSNYWGFSYGTVIGSTYADMFPSDVNRVVLDGVIEMPDYYSGRWWTSSQDIDEEFMHFFDECEHSNNCQLKKVSTTGKLMLIVMEWLDASKTQPGFALGSILNDTLIPPQLVTHSSVMLTFFEILREPLKWPALADSLYYAITENDFSGLARPAGPGEESEEYYAIGCSDSLSPPRDFGIGEYKVHSEPSLQDSVLFGDLFSPSGVMCTGLWPIRAVERHTGNFTSHTYFPLLISGNDLDPVTPGKCADDLADTFPNAISVRRAGYGHCSFSQPSKCIDKIAHNYFVNGILPKKNTRCEVDQPIFDY